MKKGKQIKFMISSNDYEEVYEILSQMDKMTVMKIPIDILNDINEKRNKNYVSNIDKNDLFNFNNISENAKNILAWLDVNYWIDIEKREKLKRKALLIAKEEEKLKQKKYSYNVFDKSRGKIKDNNGNGDYTSLCISKKNFFQKIISKLKIFKCLHK